MSTDNDGAYEPLLPLDLPALPYPDGGQRSSGWSGSDTSHERALARDADGTTSERQRRVLEYLRRQGRDGATWKEVSGYFAWHHGQASGALSTLHKERHIARLAVERRSRCAVYVLPEHVEGRATEEQGRKATQERKHTGPHAVTEEWRVLATYRYARASRSVTQEATYANIDEARFAADTHERHPYAEEVRVQHRFVTEWKDAEDA
jgi:hypothetical protein